LARLLTMPNFVALQEVCNTFAVENLCSLKLCYAPMPRTVHFVEIVTHTPTLNYYYIHLTAFFQDNLGKPAPER